MGLLVNGVWTDQWYDTKSSGGRFVRKDAAFRNWLTADGTPVPPDLRATRANSSARPPQSATS